jgi:hypothetical protein
MMTRYKVNILLLKLYANGAFSPELIDPLVERADKPGNRLKTKVKKGESHKS